MKQLASIATFFIATYALSSGASGQEVYRCGNNYSQKPCADAVLVDVTDARSQAQKEEADAVTRREAATANAMEKARLKEEAQLRADRAKLASAEAKKAATKPKAAASAPDTGGATSAKAKKSGAKKKKASPHFTARTNTQKPQPVASANK